MASFSVTTLRLSSSLGGVACFDVFEETYGLAQPPPLAEATPAAGAVVVAGVSAPAAGLEAVEAPGFGLGVVDAFAAFIHAYFPVPRPAA